MFLASKDVRLLSRDGKLLWTKKFDGRSPAGVEPFAIGDTLIVSSIHGQMFAVKSDGESAWAVLLKGTPTLATYTDGHILVTTRVPERARGALSAIDPIKGEIEWTPRVSSGCYREARCAVCPRPKRTTWCLQ